MRKEVNNLINHCLNCVQQHGDGFDQVADDLTDALEKLTAAEKVTRGAE